MLVTTLSSRACDGATESVLVITHQGATADCHGSTVDRQGSTVDRQGAAADYSTGRHGAAIDRLGDTADCSGAIHRLLGCRH
jgi:hypothetical protein